MYSLNQSTRAVYRAVVREARSQVVPEEEDIWQYEDEIPESASRYIAVNGTTQHYRPCKAKTANRGRPCRGSARPGSDYCHSHKNYSPQDEMFRSIAEAADVPVHHVRRVLEILAGSALEKK